MSEWKEYKLGEIAEITMGQSPKGETCNNDGVGIPLLNGPTEFGSHCPLPTQYTTDPRKFSEPEDLLFCVRGSTTGRMNWSDQKYAIGRGIGAIRHKKGAKLKHFIKGLIDYNLPHLLQIATGSTFPNVSKEQLNNLIIRAPDLPTQTAIAEILSSLDDKIELNNQINQELENLAQTLFKQWFIDFEFPIRANCDSPQPVGYKSSGGEMVDSELGKIPKGWEVKPITDFIEVKDGTHDSPKQCENGYYLITSKHLKNSFIDFDSAYKISNEDFVNVNKRSKVDKHDILITMIGTVGNLYYVGNEPNYAIKNIGLFKSSSNKTFSIYLYEYLKSSFISEYYRVRLAGSTQQYLTLKALRETPIIYSENVVSEFVDAIKEMRNSIINNSNENQELTNLRDTLLPKLISGELEVKEINISI